MPTTYHMYTERIIEMLIKIGHELLLRKGPHVRQCKPLHTPCQRAPRVH